MLEIQETALLVIDVQMEFADRLERGVPRTTPDAESNISDLLASTRQLGVAVIHVHHHSLEPDSPFKKDKCGCPDISP